MASRWSQVSVTRAGTYVDRDPLRSGGRKRTKESTAPLRHHFLNSDTDREGRLTALRASNALTSPITFISTLPSRPMDLWRVNGSPIESQGTALKLLAIAIGSESTCTDCNRVPRLRFPPRTPPFCHVQFHCKSTPESTPIPTAIRRGFRLDLPTEKTLGNSANAGFASRRFARLSFTTHSREVEVAMGHTFAFRRYPDGRRCHDARSPPSLRDFRSTLLLSWARDCARCA
jgi:hypothetical protein